MPHPFPLSLSQDQKIEILYWMLINREVDDRISKLYRQGKTVGAAYGGRGQEATTIGSVYALEEHDVCAPMIRNGGAFLVRGLEPGKLLANFMAKADTPTRGKDGNTHMGILDLGIFAPISHLGALIPVCAGAAMTFKMRKEKRVALTWIGDGGASTIDFHEGLNWAAVMNLPFVLVLENNQYAYSTPISKQVAQADFTTRGKAYGVEAIQVDGNNVLDVYAAVKYAVEKARTGGGPTLVVSITMRMRGHAEHDDAFYVPKEMLTQWAEKDPILRYEKFLSDSGVLNETSLQTLKTKVNIELDKAEEFALNSPLPSPEETLEGVYAP
jgi:TPP-dependent pyruvate/acetoin dehydrogenase alpha subunit